MSWLWLALGAALIQLVLAELFDWFHRLAEFLVRRAALRLPTTDRNRWEEEWLAELDALPGRHLSHLLWAGGIWLGAPHMSRALRQQPSLVRRGLDIAMSAGLLLVLLPALLGIALAVRVESPGPVLHRRRTIDRHGKTFQAFRFRTLPPVDQSHRRAPVGRLVERHSLSELPLLVNVLRGDLSAKELLRGWIDGSE